MKGKGAMVAPVKDPMDYRAEDAISAAFRAHGAALHRLALRLCGDQQVAEDAIADTFVKVLSRRSDAPIDALYPYLRRALVNQVNNWLRRRSVERAWARVRHADHRGAGDVDVQVIDRLVVRAAMANLGQRQRTVLVLRFFEGLDVKGTAELMGTSEGTVKSQTARALDRLRALLAMEGPAPPPLTTSARRVPGSGLGTRTDPLGRSTDAS